MSFPQMAVAGSCPIPPFLCSVMGLLGFSQGVSFKNTSPEFSLDLGKFGSPDFRSFVFTFSGMTKINLHGNTYHNLIICFEGVAGCTLGIGDKRGNQR
jgi:hypothetical protein